MRETANATLALERLAEGLPDGWGARRQRKGFWEIQTNGRWDHHPVPTKQALAALARCAMAPVEWRGLGWTAQRVRDTTMWTVLCSDWKGTKTLHNNDGLPPHDEATLIQIGA